MVRFTILIAVLFSYQSAIAQTIIGSVFDNANQEPLIGAIVSIKSLNVRALTDNKGVFNLKVNSATEVYTLTATYIGYEETKFTSSASTFAPIQIGMKRKPLIGPEVQVIALKYLGATPSSVTNLDKKSIERLNNAQDLPYLLNQTPNVVVNADAGNGIGYTGIRIRGADITRINVTLNGIPVNDAESHGVFWVNMPDLASSLQNIQIQRGVGTSTNGAASFGASINLQTNALSAKPYAKLLSTVGSYNTLRTTFSAGTGLINQGWYFDLRASLIQSDGYINRASSHLRSMQLSGGKRGDKSLFSFNVISGKEKTYQAWYGVPQDSLASNRKYNPAGSYIDTLGNIKYYDNETDNYQQDHYQLFYTYFPNNKITFNSALFLTRGRGFYEQFRQNDLYASYGLPNLNDSMTTTDFIRQLWLDNYFYGTTFSMQYVPNNKQKLVWGGAMQRYNGAHFGNVVWARNANLITQPYQYYNNDATKSEVNTYIKYTNKLFNNKLDFFVDLQWRGIRYDFLGYNAQLQQVTQQASFSFFNPKIGFGYAFNPYNSAHFYTGIAHREPVRDDFTNSTNLNRPLPERLIDVELSYRYAKNNWLLESNVFYMLYKNQLVLTGNINNVGAYIRSNVANSFRAGVELNGSYRFNKFMFSGNISLSRNRVKNINIFADDFDSAYNYLGTNVIANLHHSTLAFSPAIVGGVGIQYQVFNALSIALNGKYVGKQFLDNSADNSRALKPFALIDVVLNYEHHFKSGTFWGLKLNLMNITNSLYSANGYTFLYRVNGRLFNGNNYFPQAPFNYLATLTLGF